MRTIKYSSIALECRRRISSSYRPFSFIEMISIQILCIQYTVFSSFPRLFLFVKSGGRLKSLTKTLGLYTILYSYPPPDDDDVKTIKLRRNNAILTSVPAGWIGTMDYENLDHDQWFCQRLLGTAFLSLPWHDFGQLNDKSHPVDS